MIKGARRTALAVAVSIAALAPAPGQAQGPATTPITLPEARELMDFPPGAWANGFIGASQLKIGILDDGYVGLEEWLEANPKEAALTKIISLKPGDTGTHGYRVYRIARQVLGDAEIYLYDQMDSTDEVVQMLEDMKSRGIQIVNASFGVARFPINRTATDAFTAAMLNEARKQEIFVFYAAGNFGSRVHSFIAEEAEQSYIIPGLTVPHPGAVSLTPDRLPVRPQGGRLAIEIYWDRHALPDGPVALQLDRTDGRSVALVTHDGQQQNRATFDEAGGKTETKSAMLPGRLQLELSGLANEEFHLILRKTATAAKDAPMRLHVREGIARGPLNGRESGLPATVFESPFAVAVGAMSRASDGLAAPTSFSSWGTTSRGEKIPHTLGPGQVDLDGAVFQGTSFAAPFLTSMLATAHGYNPKNILERVSDHSRLSPQVPTEERSRWGTPSMIKLAQLRSLVGPTKVENWSHRVEGAALRVDTTFTRCCMEGMTYNPVLELYRLRDAGDGKVTAERVIDPTTKRAAFIMLDKRARGKDIEKEPITFNLPLDKLSLEPGRYQLRFGFFIKAWPSTTPHRPHEGGFYEFALN